MRDDNILNEEVHNFGSVVQSGDEDGGDATSLPSSPMDADIGMNDNEDNDDNSNNNVNMNNIKKRTSPRLERRRNKHPAPPPPPGIDYITVPYGSTEHDNHHHPSVIIDEDISTIYGGVWNSGALLTGGRRLEDMMGCLEEGYAIHSSSICGIGGLKYDPNTYSQLRMKQPTKHRCQQPNCVSVSPKPKSQFCVEEDVEETRKTVALWNVWRQQRLCVDGSLVALLLVVVLSFIAIIVLVLRK